VSESAQGHGSIPDAAGSRGGLWWWCLYLMSTVGLLCTYAEWGWEGLVTAALTIATFVVAIGGCAWAEQGRRGAARVAALTVSAGVVLTAAVGLLAVFHVIALSVVLLLAVSSPAVIAPGRRFFVGHGNRTGSAGSGAAPGHPGAGVEPAGHELVEPVAPDVSTLDDVALCLAWRRSFMRLNAARSELERLWVVEQRQRYLDELHRRSPKGLVAWFNAGGRASGDPLPFLDYRSDDDPWQGLTPPDAGGAHL
jgi:hypothetical protein